MTPTAPTPDTHNQRTRLVAFRCRPDEHQVMTETARQEHVTVSEWIRRVLQSAARYSEHVQTIGASPETVPDLYVMDTLQVSQEPSCH